MRMSASPDTPYVWTVVESGFGLLRRSSKSYAGAPPPGLIRTCPSFATRSAVSAAARDAAPVLFVSGYRDAMPVSATPTSNVAFLAKPFPSSRLVAAVAKLLRAHELT
jgi:hypothetical protein